MSDRRKKRKKRKKKEEKSKKRRGRQEMGSFGRINELLALAKCLKPWDWLFSTNEVDKGVR